MKTKFIETRLLLETWRNGVSSILFPDDVKTIMDPESTLNGMGSELSLIRERSRDKVDSFISSIFTFDTPGSLKEYLQQTDPMIVALYYDRILAATFALEQACSGMEAVEIPSEWESTIRLLLFQKLFQ